MNPTVTAVPGVTAGHAATPSGGSGVTVVRFDGGARAAVWVPGSATGSREWGVLDADHLATDVHAVCLAGGSAFGLAAADGVVRALVDDGVGFDTLHGRVPLVPAAILFDLDVSSERPGFTEGFAAARACRTDPLPAGAVGAGCGARVGRGLGAPVPGGIGTGAVRVDAWTVGVVVAVNAFGAVFDPRTGAPVSHPEPPAPKDLGGDWTGATTLAVVVTDAPVPKPACRVLAKMASAAFARCFRPAFTPFDGDVVFAASTGVGSPVDPLVLTRLGDAAADALGEAIVSAVTTR